MLKIKNEIQELKLNISLVSVSQFQFSDLKIVKSVMSACKKNIILNLKCRKWYGNLESGTECTKLKL